MSVRLLFAFDGNINIPDPSFNDDCFDIFGDKVKVTTKTFALQKLVEIVLQDKDCQEAVLNALVRSRYFEIHAKQIRSLQIQDFTLNDWMPFWDDFIEHQPKLKKLSLRNCHLTQRGSLTLAWLLDNQDSGMQIKILDTEKPTGDYSWVFGLVKNTSIKILTAKQLDDDTKLNFFQFLGRTSSLSQFQRLDYDGSHNEISSPNEKCLFKIHLGSHDETWWFRQRHRLFFYMTYEKGMAHLNMEGKSKWQGQFGTHSIVFQNALTFQKEQQPEEISLNFGNLKFEGQDQFVLTLLTSCRKSAITLIFRDCYFTEQAANQLCLLLDTDTSRMNIQDLTLSGIEGNTTALATGLHKNKTIKTLYLQGFDFLLSSLHFLCNGKANNKLEDVHLQNLGEEQDGKPLGLVNNEEAAPEEGSTSTPTDALTSFTIDFDAEVIRFSTSVCESIGSVLRRSTNLKSLKIKGVMINSGHDFLKDIVSCQDELYLEKTEFEPHVVASLINNGEVKRLCFEDYQTVANGETFVELLNQIDWTLLDEIKIGKYMGQEVLSALCHLFAQNKGPRKFTRRFEIFDDEETNDIINLKEWTTSLTGNTRIQELELTLNLALEPRDMLNLLRPICKMPSLKKLKIEDSYFHWEDVMDETEYNRMMADLVKYKHFVFEQFVTNKNNIEMIEMPGGSWKGDEKFEAMLKTFQNIRQLLSCNANDLPDGIWARAFMHATKNSGWDVYDEEKQWDFPKETLDILFYLVRQVPGLFQRAGEKKDDKDDEGPNFLVPHHPDCPGCLKRKRDTCEP